MKLYNKSQRAIILNRKDALSGCRFPTDEAQKDKAYFDGETTADITDAIAEKFLRDYPKEIMKMGEGSGKSKRRAAVRRPASRRTSKKTPVEV